MRHPHRTWHATFGLLSDTALADNAVLDNRARLSGTVVPMTTEALESQTLRRHLKRPWARVSRIESDAPGRVRIGSLAETTPLTFDRVPRSTCRIIHAGLIFKLHYAIWRGIFGWPSHPNKLLFNIVLVNVNHVYAD